MKNRTKLPNLYLVLILALMYLPILLVMVYSFNDSKISSVWSGFSLKWYTQLFRDRAMLEALGNTLILGLSSCLCAGIIGTLGAFGMTRVKWRLNAPMEYLSTLPMMVPEIILGMVFMAFFSLIGLPFGLGTLMIAHTAFCIPYVFMLVKARLVGLDPLLAAAVRDLGAGPVRAFFDITLPLISPAIASGMLLAFAMSIDDVIISVFVTGVDVNTLPIKIYTQLKTGVTPEINALCTLMFLATLLLCGLSALLGRGRRLEVPGEGASAGLAEFGKD
ncbi:MAG: ABC transporter permease [Acutalibacter sp.]|jgi:spermidine/putrescine transport system permease protein|nr:ABC transporter permease [Acutalibacter sp.]